MKNSLRALTILCCFFLLTPVIATAEDIYWYDPKELTSPTVQDGMTPSPTATPIPDVESFKEEDGSTLLTFSFTGDVTIGGDVRKNSMSIFDKELAKQEGDITFPFRNVKSIFEADDMTLVNFEGTLTTFPINPEKKNNSFLFSAPPSYVEVLTSGGVDAVALENNHVYDHGLQGYQQTQETLGNADIVYSGNGEIGVFEAKGIEIAMLSYQTFDQYPVLFEQVPVDIAAANSQYPIVIVSFHWGAEMDYRPNDNQQKMGKLAIDSGADLVVGHHSHRINPIEEYNGKYICYSLGNFSFAGNTKPNDMSTYIFQTRFRISPEGDVNPDGFIIIPCRISSKSEYNDFMPTPYEKQSSIDSLLSVLASNGEYLVNPVPVYPLSWDYWIQ